MCINSLPFVYIVLGIGDFVETECRAILFSDW